MDLRKIDSAAERAESTSPNGATSLDDRIRITVNLSGGAAKCAFQAGYLYNLAKNGIEFSEIHAVSGGVINAYFAKSGRIDELKEFWLEEIPAHTNRFKWYAGIPLNILTRKRGLISSDFINELIEKKVDSIPEGMFLNVISLFDGEERTLSARDFDDLEEFKKAMYAAVAIPAVFAPVDVTTKTESILDAADGGIHEPFCDVKTDLSISVHHYEKDIQRVKGPASSLFRVAELRGHERSNGLWNEPGLVQPAQTLPKTWDWRKDSLTWSFQHGMKESEKYINNIS